MFAVCFFAGVGARGLQLVHASGPACFAYVKAELLEVRRVEGTGDISEQEASWQEHLLLEVENNRLSLSMSDPLSGPVESLLLDIEVQP